MRRRGGQFRLETHAGFRRDVRPGMARMARPSEKAAEYIKTIEAMKWPALSKLWQAVRNSSATEWEAGKAFEHLVIRGFAL